MKALVQRVARGCVTVDGQPVGRIGQGFVVLLGVRTGDGEAEARHLAQKTANLRVFEDAAGKMNLSVQDIEGEILVVSQFTLYADTRKGNRPSFIEAAPPELAQAMYGVYVDTLRRILGERRVATGVFRATMSVELVNDGPVTVELRSEAGG
jgi:D-tyrosyl-tRNA(Tyr) deacylase